VIKSAAQQEAARKFVSFVLSQQGQQILANKGYSKADAQ
jgi:ABC-type Fe3+ transport system substrate-binding protein